MKEKPKTLTGLNEHNHGTRRTGKQNDCKTAKELADEYIEKNWDNWNWKWKNRLLESIRLSGD